MINLIDYTGWLREDIVTNEDFEKIKSDMELFQANFIAKHYSLYRNGYFSINSQLYTGDAIYGWSRQYEYPFVYANIANHKAQNNQNYKLKILDVGCGFNFFPYFLSEYCNCEVFTSDILDFSSFFENTEVKFVQDDITKTQIEERFDIIYCVSVLEHLSFKEQAIQSMLKLLKEDGKLILTMDCDLGRDLSDTTPAIEEMYHMISLLNSYFHKPWSSCQLSRTSDLITTDHFINTQSWRLPWKKRREVEQKKSTLKNKIKFLFMNLVHLSDSSFQAELVVPSLAVFLGIWELQDNLLDMSETLNTVK